MAVLGTPASTTTLVQQVLLPENIRYQVLDQWLDPGKYEKFSVVYFTESLKYVKGVTQNMWGGVEQREAVERFVRSGGVIVLTGATFYHLANLRDLQPIASILGFGYCGGVADGKQATKFRVVDRASPVTNHLRKDEYDWKGWSIPISKVTTAATLAEQLDETGNVLLPFVTVNDLGKGKVYWFSAPLFRLYYKREPTAKADENGRYVLTPRGEDIEAYRLMLVRAIRQGNPATGDLKREEWDPTPLGNAVEVPQVWEPRTVETPAPRAPKPRKGQPVLLADNGQSRSVLVTPERPTDNELHVATVLREHLQAIMGADAAVVKPSALGDAEVSPQGIRPTDKEWAGLSFIVVGNNTMRESLSVTVADLGPEGMALKTAGNAIVVTGKDEAGLRHAAYAFLEELGCRYLWPGALGKVIPRKPTLRVPPLDIRESPRLWSRSIRSRPAYRSSRMDPGFKKLGIAREACAQRFDAAAKSVPPDDGWFAWHRMGSHRTVARGHSFGDYWQRFGKDHPDWFALQPNGVRDQSLSPARPRLCHSNRELIAQIVRDRLDALRNDPEAPGVPVGLNDGGYTTFCMCENCRKLDPANGREVSLLDCVAVPRRNFRYVSLTDRVLWFTNRIAEGVAREFPDKHLGFYAYSAYDAPPLKVKPHPNLIIFYVGDSLEEWNGWTRFGNKVFWRPNVLLAHRRKTAPQNFSRELFQKFQHMYNTGLIGTDFDSCQHQWALKGLIYYVLAKAHWDPRTLDYEALVEDYCRSGFGAAWKPIRRYFDILEDISSTAAKRQADLIDAYGDGYLRKLQACLDEARAEAAGHRDPSVPKRVEFLQLGLDLAKRQMELHKNPDDDAVKQRFREFLLRANEENPVAINVPLVATHGRF